ncbi:winged helix-turn-helix domain-containing protein [Streptomyces sp. BP-8]|uniref:helix-turn-helix domain-containing protein n=1 Tax=Streptomyces sirii TaxID=3127701 RepID=UPI00388E5F10
MSRVRTLIAHTLGIDLSIREVWELLRRHGWSCQQPARRAIERDEGAVAGWINLHRSLRVLSHGHGALAPGPWHGPAPVDRRGAPSVGRGSGGGGEGAALTPRPAGTDPDTATDAVPGEAGHVTSR